MKMFTTRNGGIFIAAALSCLVVASESSSCTDGYNLNYTLPMFVQCKVKIINGSEVQLIPKLIPRKFGAKNCYGRAHDNIPPGYRICRIPDCLKEPCKNGWCQEEMTNYTCHCSPEFTGKHCESRIPTTQASRRTSPDYQNTSEKLETTGTTLKTKSETTPVVPTTHMITTEANTARMSTTEADTEPSATTAVTAEAETTSVMTTEAGATRMVTTEADTTRMVTTEADTTRMVTTDANQAEMVTTEAETTSSMTTESTTETTLMITTTGAEVTSTPSATTPRALTTLQEITTEEVETTTTRLITVSTTQEIMQPELLIPNCDLTSWNSALTRCDSLSEGRQLIVPFNRSFILDIIDLVHDHCRSAKTYNHIWLDCHSTSPSVWKCRDPTTTGSYNRENWVDFNDQLYGEHPVWRSQGDKDRSGCLAVKKESGKEKFLSKSCNNLLARTVCMLPTRT